MRWKLTNAVAAAMLLSTPQPAPAADPVRSAQAGATIEVAPVAAPLVDPPVDYASEVAPLLTRRCFACHGPDLAESGLALHEADLALAETDSGLRAIMPGDPHNSELLRRVASEEDWQRMPPEGEPLSADEVDVLRRWIASGAEFEKHWAFEPRQRVAPPAVQGEGWVSNPIDRFILARLEAAGVEPSPQADRRTLIRRLSYDLIGLPPTPAEVEAFVADDRPDAYERLVDELLASPHYGENWARHWLDVVRYAETNSFERDAAKPNAWKYRDYVIRSLNEDKPYEQFVREQLAGDELDEVTEESIIATGYYRLGVWDDEPADPLQAKYDELDDLVSTTSQAFLGLTVGCARCHDHKIDPIPQTDYYGMVALLADVTPYGTRGDEATNSQWDLSPPDKKAERERLAERRAAIAEERTSLEQAAIARMDGPDQRRTETAERGNVLREKLEQHQTEAERSRYLDLADQLADADTRLAALGQPETALSLATCDPKPAPTRVLMRGNPHVPGEEVTPRFPELFADPAPEIPEPGRGARSAGRRRVLAEWIASPENRLTSRVIANRVWQHHFGRGIVRSANNFGQLGTPPTHPELLDWLAGWLIEHEWRLKPLHRLIVTSSTYRMSSLPSGQAASVDPANDLFWRYDLRRLTAEQIRDTVLTVSGQLDRSLYGPSVYPKLSDEVLHTQSVPGKGWDTTPEAAEAAKRRSVYIHIKRSLIPPELASFDFPETDTSCEARFNTVQPAQALSLMHGGFLQEQSAALADRVRREGPDDLQGRVEHALGLVLQRPADSATVSDSLQLIGAYQAKHNLSAEAAFDQFCLMAMSLNEFVFVD
ncbi:PSD1 and planctomycete cytochrome C domain-containing protein [Botrimarina sp.]|uniref:PSD1 and planctomycete cytochrome C domain-containing protein n=1 Tax=Botrimarina sp. TaxID=2795802 RepID=UPI0032EE816B